MDHRLNSVIMSRFILNLRDTTSSSGELGMTSTPPSVYTDIDFTTSDSGVLGNIGASVISPEMTKAMKMMWSEALHYLGFRA